MFINHQIYSIVMIGICQKIFEKVFSKCFQKWWKYSPHVKSDKLYLRLLFFFAMRKPLNLRNPKTFSEKLQWLKLFAYKKEYSDMVDKVKAKEFAAKIIGQEYIIPTLGVWDSADDIDFNMLPDRFVLKCNHNSGTGMYICKDKTKMNEVEVREGLRKGLEEDYFLPGRDKPYRDVERKILAEAYMEDSRTKELRDYKFFCFDGVVKAMFIAKDRQNRAEPYFDFFDADFNHLPFKQGHPNAPVLPEKPECFEEMKLLAAKLSKGIPHVRVDFYEVNGKVYFGEMTFYHFGGITPFEPNSWDRTFGDWINLPQKQ